MYVSNTTDLNTHTKTEVNFRLKRRLLFFTDFVFPATCCFYTGFILGVVLVTISSVGHNQNTVTLACPHIPRHLWCLASSGASKCQACRIFGNTEQNDSIYKLHPMHNQLGVKNSNKILRLDIYILFLLNIFFKIESLILHVKKKKIKKIEKDRDSPFKCGPMVLDTLVLW